MNKLQINTGRLYTREGQVIVIAWDDEFAYFADHSRMIDGAIPLVELPQDQQWTAGGIKALVMNAYDTGRQNQDYFLLQRYRDDMGNRTVSFYFGNELYERNIDLSRA